MKVRITTTPGRLNFRYPFRIAHGERTGTDVVLVKAEVDGHAGYGEATLPPYLHDSIESVQHFFSLPIIQNIQFPFHPNEISSLVGQAIRDNMPAKAALDMALWELFASFENNSVAEAVGIVSKISIPHSYTIGVGDFDEMKIKLTSAIDFGFTFFKLKLDGIHDEEILFNYKRLSTYPFAVDANQAWTNLHLAKKMGEKLQESGCLLIEQPFQKLDLENSRALREMLAIPILADEACQVPDDLERISGAFSGINIKLQKCGGISPALFMIERARSLNLKVLIGCMSESSIGCTAAEVLAPLCDWADLDGPYLISNDQEITTLIK